MWSVKKKISWGLNFMFSSRFMLFPTFLDLLCTRTFNMSEEKVLLHLLVKWGVVSPNSR